MRHIDTAAIAIAALLAVAVVPNTAKAAPSACNAVSNNLIVNCGFETGSFSGWTQSGNTGFTGVTGPTAAHTGAFYAFLGPIGSDGFLSQTFNDTAGQTLSISFYLASDGGTPSDFHASFNSTSLLSVTNLGPQGYTLYSYTATATGHDTLTLGGFRDDPGFLSLDDVVVAARVPEPASLALVGAGLCSLGFLRRRKTAK